MPLSDKQIYFDDYVFVVDENVYEPAEDSFLFAENLELEAGERIMDMGTGCGILGIIAAEKVRGVIAVDLNPYAVFLAKQNAALNNVSNKIDFVQADLFKWLSEKTKFDVILFNAPYLPAKANKMDPWIEYAWAGGAAGRQIIDRFISEVKKYLKHNGRVLLMQSTLANVNETLIGFAEAHLKAEVVAERMLPFFETLILLEARM
jgi:release factor glutamine methyltransferase